MSIVSLIAETVSDQLNILLSDNFMRLFASEASIDYVHIQIQNNFLVVVLIIVLNRTHNEIVWIIGYLALIINFEKQIEMINFNQKKQH